MDFNGGIPRRKDGGEGISLKQNFTSYSARVGISYNQILSDTRFPLKGRRAISLTAE